MKNRNIFVASIIAVGLMACNQPAKTGFNGNLANSADSVGYAMGINIASNIKQQGLEEFNEEAMAAAVKAIMAGDSNTLMTNEESGQFLNTYFRTLQDRKMQADRAEADEKERAFLDENGARPEVQTTASGLQYEVIQEGSGVNPLPTDEVTVHYTGTLTDGSVFDSSVERGEPAKFRLNQVIPGWTEGVGLMKKGAKYKLYIPYSLGYGERGAGASIPPFSTLVFEVELLDINAAS